MCWMCDHPGASPQDYLDHLRSLIRDHGWAIQNVEGDRVTSPWAYTAGLTAKNHPELVMTGLDGREAANELNDAAGLLITAGLPEPGDPFLLPSSRVAEIVTVTRPWAHLLLDVSLYGEHGFTALQLVHRDGRRRWPWDEGYSGLAQPVLGERTVQL